MTGIDQLLVGGGFQRENRRDFGIFQSRVKAFINFERIFNY
jgi:hypothetical protein